MSVALRLLGPGDAAVLARVAEGVFDEPVRPDRAAAHLAEPGHLMLVALDGDLVVGQCAAVIHRHPDKATELYVDEVGVADGWRRRGIGRAMLDRILREGRQEHDGLVLVLRREHATGGQHLRPALHRAAERRREVVCGGEVGAGRSLDGC